MRVFSSTRGRKPRTGGAGNKGRVQLNARIPEQLAFAFNAAAPKGQRDNLVVDALERFLAARPADLTSQSAAAIATDIDQMQQISSDRDALELIRYHAAAILQIADAAARTRKRAKASPAGSSRKRRRQA